MNKPPPMIPTPTGPVSAWDEEYKAKTGLRLDADEHAIKLPSGERRAWVIHSSAELHSMAMQKPGRPLRFTLGEARTIKAAYWSGQSTIAGLARANDTTCVTISRLVHSQTYWWT